MNPKLIVTLLAVQVLLSTAFASGPPLTKTSAPDTNWISIASSADATKIIAVAAGGFPPPSPPLLGPAHGPGPIYISSDAGASWQISSAPFLKWNRVSSSADGNKLAATVYGGGIFLSDDAGLNWTHATDAPDTNWTAIASSSDGMRLVAAATGLMLITNTLFPYTVEIGSIYLSSDGGATWSRAINLPEYSWRNVASSADGMRLFALNGGAFYASADGGESWTRGATNVASLGWSCLATAADGVHLAIGSEGGLFLSTNSGHTFVWPPRGERERAVVSSADGSHLISFQSTGWMKISSDFGATWSYFNSGLPGWSSAAASTDGKSVIAAINRGGIYKLDLSPKLPSCVTLPALGTNDSVLLKSTVNPNGAETTAWFEWGTNSNYEFSSIPISIGSGWMNIPVNLFLTNLLNGVEYHFRIVASNSVGLSSGENVIYHVPGAKRLIEEVLEEMKEFYEWTEFAPVRHSIGRIERALLEELWLEQMRLEKKKGSRVFTNGAGAVQRLVGLMKNKRYQFPKPTVQDWIDRLVKANRLLAIEQLQEVEKYGATDKRFARALKQLANGDLAANNQKYVAAISRYGCSWRLATRVIQK